MGFCLGCGGPPAPSQTANEENLGPELPAGLSLQSYENSRAAFFAAYGRVPSRLDAISYAAELALAKKQYRTASACFAEIPSGHPQYGHLARYQQGFALLKLNRADEAETAVSRNSLPIGTGVAPMAARGHLSRCDAAAPLHS